MFIRCFDESRCLHHLVRVLTAFQRQAEQQDPKHQNVNFWISVHLAAQKLVQLWVYCQLEFFMALQNAGNKKPVLFISTECL